MRVRRLSAMRTFALALAARCAGFGFSSSSCPAGQEWKITTTTTTLPGGGYYTSTSSGCQLCEAGKYQSLSPGYTCLGCPAGRAAPTTGQTTCDNCNAGHYQNQTAQATCEPCAAGQYQNQTTQVECVSCAAGQYQNLAGQSSCTACPAGSYTDFVGATLASQCLVPTPSPTPASPTPAPTPHACSAAVGQAAPGIRFRSALGGFTPATFSAQAQATYRVALARRLAHGGSDGAGSGGAALPMDADDVCLTSVSARRSLRQRMLSSAASVASTRSLVRFDVVILPGAAAAQTDLALATLRGRVSAVAHDAAVAAQFRAEVKAELDGAGIGIPSIADFDDADLAAETPFSSIAMVNPASTPSPTESVARACALGTYANSGGRAPCTPCSTGQYSDMCPFGRVAADSWECYGSAGPSSCKACPAGKYQGKPGQRSCEACHGGICFVDVFGANEVALEVLSQTSSLNVFGWDALTNVDGNVTKYEVLGAKITNDPALFRSRVFTDELVDGLDFRVVNFSTGNRGRGGTFQDTDPIRLLQKPSPTGSRGGAASAPAPAASVVDPHFVEPRGNTLYFFKLRVHATVAAAPGGTVSTRNSSVLKGVVGSPKAPQFITTPSPILAKGAGALPYVGDRLVYNVTFKGKPQPSVTWKFNGEPLLSDGQAFAAPSTGPLRVAVDAPDFGFTPPRLLPTVALSPDGDDDVYLTSLVFDSVERRHFGRWELELSNYIATTRSPKVLLSIECQDCSQCDANARIDSKNTRCICNRGFFMDEAPSQNAKLPFSCTLCPVGFVCETGDDTLASVAMEEGYYRHQPTDREAMRCNDTVAGGESCAGGRIAAQCVGMATGVLCHTCVSNTTHAYAMDDGSGQCAMCEESGFSVSGLAATFVILLFFAYVAAVWGWMVDKVDLCKWKKKQEAVQDKADEIAEKKDKIQESAEIAAEQVDDAEEHMREMLDAARARAEHAVLTARKAKIWVSHHVPDAFYPQQLKIFVTWAQIQTSFIHTFSVPWPTGFSTLLASCYSWFNIDILAIFGDWQSVKCQMDTSFYSQLVAHMMFLPVLLGGTLMAAYVARRTHPEKAQHTNVYCIKTAAFLVFLLYPGICSKIFTVFKCVAVSDTAYLVADLNVECYGAEHNGMMAFASVFMCLYALGIPAGTFWLLWRNSKKVQTRDKTFQLEFGQLYMGYVSDAWYFEVVEMVRKLILSGALIVLEEAGATQVLIGALVCAAYTVAFLLVHPLGRGEDFVLQLIASCQLMITLLMGLYLLGNGDESGSTQSEDAVADGLLNTMFVLTFLLGLAMTAITFTGDHPWVTEKLATVWGLRHVWRGHHSMHVRNMRKLRGTIHSIGRFQVLKFKSVEREMERIDAECAAAEVALKSDATIKPADAATPAVVLPPVEGDSETGSADSAKAVSSCSVQ